MKIKHRFLLVFMLVTAVTAGVLVVAFDGYRTDLQADVIETTEQNAESAAASIDGRLAAHEDTVEVAATNPALAAHGEASQREALSTFVDDSVFTGASVVDADGRMVAIEGVGNGSRESVIGDDYSDREYVQRALAGETYVSDPFQADTDNHIVVISTPLVDDNGSTVGTLNAAYDLTESALFSSMGTDDETGISVTANGSTLYSTADRFDESATATAAVDSTGLVVTSHYDAAAIDADLRRLGGLHLLVSVLLIGTITGFGIWIYQSELRHTERLHRRIDNIAARTYDDDIEFNGATEWRAIGDALDRLSTTLGRREQMLLVLNRFLRHNLRNELNVAAGYAADVKREAATPDDRRRAEVIESSIGEVLSTADRVRLTEKLVDPAALEGQSVDLMAALIERIEAVTADTPALTVTLDGPDSVRVHGGETLAFAIEELLENVAVHAGPEPVAHVSVTPHADTVVLRIADNGPGIHPEEAAVITGATEISPLSHSSGLGLWLVNWIVRRHGGTLAIPDSDDGTTIELTLPRVDEDS